MSFRSVSYVCYDQLGILVGAYCRNSQYPPYGPKHTNTKVLSLLSSSTMKHVDNVLGNVCLSVCLSVCPTSDGKIV